ncbi:MAG: hypothetical protein ACREVQ_02330 [Burkholderiales bacterium]
MAQGTELGGLNWKASDRTSASYCNLASAVAAADAVVLNLGQSQGAGRTGAEASVELLHRVVLSPLAARNLQQLLSRVIGEHDAQGGRPR